MSINILYSLLMLIVSSEVIYYIIEIILSRQMHDSFTFDSLVIAYKFPGIVGSHLIYKTQSYLLVRVILE